MNLVLRCIVLVLVKHSFPATQRKDDSFLRRSFSDMVERNPISRVPFRETNPSFIFILVPSISLRERALPLGTRRKLQPSVGRPLAYTG